MNQERILMRSRSEDSERQRADYQRQKGKLLRLAETGNLVAGRKKCFKCHQTKSLDEFYLHPQMADGRLGKCKECTKGDVAERIVSKRDAAREYEAWRQSTTSRRSKKIGYCKKHKQRNPEKAYARTAIAYAVKSGRIKRLPCEVCGDPKSQAHHPNYGDPLRVQWLCFKHHRELHGQTVG